MLRSNGGRVRDWTAYMGGARPEKPCLPLYALPTTTGTGSETSGGAVITFDFGTAPRKGGLGAAQPELAFLDPALVERLPVAPSPPAAWTPTHAVESYVSLRASLFTRAFWPRLSAPWPRPSGGVTRPRGRHGIAPHHGDDALHGEHRRAGDAGRVGAGTRPVPHHQRPLRHLPRVHQRHPADGGAGPPPGGPRPPAGGSGGPCWARARAGLAEPWRRSPACGELVGARGRLRDLGVA